MGELQKKKKTLKTNLVKNATKKNEKKETKKKRRKCRYKTIHYPPHKIKGKRKKLVNLSAIRYLLPIYICTCSILPQKRMILIFKNYILVMLCKKVYNQ